MQPLNFVRSAALSFLMSILLMNSMGTTAANATQSVSALFGSICIWVFDVAEELPPEMRHDLTERVSNLVRIKVEAVSRHRKVLAASNCIKADQPGFDRQLTLYLSAKRQTIKVDGQPWLVLVAGGVSTGGLFQDRETQPVIRLQQGRISDDTIVDALVEFVDRTVVAALRRR